MTQRPTDFPDWAINDVIDSTSKESNKEKPPEIYRLQGFNYKDTAPRNWVNWQFNRQGLWIRYFDEQITGGSGGSQIKANSYTLSTMPNAGSAGSGSIIYVSNATNGGVLCFSNGANWIRVTDGTEVD